MKSGVNKAKDSTTGKYLQAYAKRYLPLGILSFFMVLAAQSIMLMPPLIMRNVMDTYIPEKNIHQTVINIIFLILLPLFAAIGQASHQWLMAVKGRKYAYELNQKIIGNILSQPMNFHDENNSGELAAKATRDTMEFVIIWTKDIPEMLASSLVAIIALILVFQINVYIGLTQILFIPLLILPSRIAGKRIQKYGERIFLTITKIRALVQEAFHGVKYVKLMGIKDILLSKYMSMYTGMNQLFSKSAAIETLLGPLSAQVLSSVFMGIGFILGAVFIINDNLTVGGMLAFIALAPRLHNGLANMMQTNVQYFKQLGEFSHLFGYMEMQEEPSGDVTLDEFLCEKICLDNVTFYYGEQSEKESVLNNLSLTLSKGKWMGIEGATGAGKSTLLNLLLLLYAPIEGAVLLDGTDCTKISKKWYRSNISVVNQTPFLFAGTVRENMMLVNDKLTVDDIWRALDEVMLTGLVKSSGKGLDMDIGEDGTLLSGGEKQRLAIAIAFAAKKPLIILDEATSNLDVDTERYIRDIIRNKVDNGLTVLSVSHRFSFHEKADRVFNLA